MTATNIDPGIASGEAVGPSGGFDAPITLADAEAALATAGGDIAVIQRRTEAAFAELWSKVGAMPGSYGLAYADKRVRREVAELMAHKPPKRVEASMILLDAARRYLRALVAPEVPPQPLTVRPVGPSAEQIVARLGAKGIRLAVDDAGRVVAMPAIALNEMDRRQLADNKVEVVRALASWEAVA